MSNNDIQDIDIEKDAAWQLAYDYIQYTGRNIFLTGNAGTGKTTFLHYLSASLFKRMVILAPTGIAALNAGGMTIHSFFQLPFGPWLPDIKAYDITLKDLPPSENDSADMTGNLNTSDNAGNKSTGFKNRLRKEKIKIIRSLDVIIIDEISMVRADILDAMDASLRHYRRNSQPFGGVQLVMIGDLQQLPPVIKNDEWNILNRYYDTGFFFSSHALKTAGYLIIELTKIHRQHDYKFISILNKIRNGKSDMETMEEINSRYIKDFKPDARDRYITLTTHNFQAKELNDNMLEDIKSKSLTYTAAISGDFPETIYPTEANLILKKGAQVMFIKNDPSPDKLFFNGKIGIVTHITEEDIQVLCEGDTDPINVTPLEWENTRYALNNKTNEIEQETIGLFTQIPLKLAWAITIHKSQGLTFNRVIIDAEAAFAHGQVYVALSRCRTFDGIVLSSRINKHGIINNEHVKEFQEETPLFRPKREDLDNDKKEYRKSLLMSLFDFTELLIRVRTVKKTITENSNLLSGNPSAEWSEMEQRTNEEIHKVADRFRIQLNTILNSPSSSETECLLQKRTGAASVYFLKKITEIIVNKINTSSFDTDSKDMEKTIREGAERILQEAAIKTACLKSCENGFDIISFSKAKALAAIQKVKLKSEQTSAAIKTWSSEKLLFNILKKWRSETAENADVSEYIIMNIKTLEQIAVKKPVSMDELLQIKGIGRKKADLFGDEIIEIVCRHLGRQ